MNNQSNEITVAQGFVQGINDGQGVNAQDDPAKFADIIKDDIGRATINLEGQRGWYRKTDLDDTLARVTRDEMSLKIAHIDYQQFMKVEINTKAHYLADFSAVAQNEREAIAQEETGEDDEDDETIKGLDQQAYKQEKQARVVKSFPTDKAMREFHGQAGEVEDNFSVSYHPLDGDTLHYYMDELSEALLSYQFNLK